MYIWSIKRREKETEAILKEIMTNNFSKIEEKHQLKESVFVNPKQIKKIN